MCNNVWADRLKTHAHASRNVGHCAVSRSFPTPAMAFVVELLVLELVHHFFIARNLFPPNVYKPLVGQE